ncbi:MAG: hypothetical protein WCF81_04330 [Roseiarcus sp.]
MPKYAFLSVALSLALGLALPTATFASTTDAPVHQHNVSPHRAHGMSHKERLKVEGLRRSPGDCAKYGCIGNN